MAGCNTGRRYAGGLLVIKFNESCIKMIKLCMFDLDGTLIDSVPDLANSINFALAQNNLPLRKREDIKANMGAGLSNLVKTSIIEELYTDELFETVRKSVISHYSDHCTDKTVLYDGIAEMLNRLLACGIKIVVITNKPHIFLDKIIGDLFKNISFTRVIGAGEYPSKPDPVALYAVMEDLGVKKEECMYIGDTAIDIHTAINAGVAAAGVSWGYQNEETLKKAGAYYIVKKPEEILAKIR